MSSSPIKPGATPGNAPVPNADQKQQKTTPEANPKKEASKSLDDIINNAAVLQKKIEKRGFLKDRKNALMQFKAGAEGTNDTLILKSLGNEFIVNNSVVVAEVVALLSSKLEAMLLAVEAEINSFEL